MFVPVPSVMSSLPAPPSTTFAPEPVVIVSFAPPSSIVKILPRVIGRLPNCALLSGAARNASISPLSPRMTAVDAPPVIDYGNRLRFYAGQPDAADASNFTIDYELDGRPGTIDGWLRNDGLQLRPREGSLTYDPNQGEVWKLPTTAPSADR